MTKMPAISLAAMPGKRQQTLEVAKKIEKAGFSGIYCPSFGDSLALCEALALVTENIHFGTSIIPIYTRHARDFAQHAAFIHEISGGRFHFGIGVSHETMMARMGLQQGKPLSDIRQFVDDIRSAGRVGDIPPILLATLRDKMIRLSAEIAEGMVFANGARSYMQHSLSVLPEDKRQDKNFFIGNMIPTLISDDKKAAAAVNKKTMGAYLTLPNYRNYWKAAGYEEEMAAIEKIIADGQRDQIADRISEKWLADVTLFGSASEVREGVEQWFDTGVRTPVLVPSSTSGGQMQAIDELIACFR